MIDALTAATSFQVGEEFGKLAHTDSFGNHPYISDVSASVDTVRLYIQLKRGENIQENSVTYHDKKWWLCSPDSPDFVKKSALGIYSTLHYSTFDDIWECYLLPMFEKQFARLQAVARKA